MPPSLMKPSFDDNASAPCDSLWCGCSRHFGKKVLCTLLGVLLVYLVFYVGTLTRNNLKKYYYIGQADHPEHTIVVTGVGKVTGGNDIAMTTIGYSNTDKDVATAQLTNKKVMDKIGAELHRLGVADKDLQTQYSVYPDYNYTQDKGQELKGYRVESSLTIKIRDFSKISTILGLAGTYGANQVQSLSFTIDDPETLKAAARDKAVADAQMKAEHLAGSLGVALGAVVSYNEYENSPVYPPYAAMTKSVEGMGGGAEMGPATVSSGSQDVVVNASITYQVLP